MISSLISKNNDIYFWNIDGLIDSLGFRFINEESSSKVSYLSNKIADFNQKGELNFSHKYEGWGVACFSHFYQ